MALPANRSSFTPSYVCLQLSTRLYRGEKRYLERGEKWRSFSRSANRRAQAPDQTAPRTCPTGPAKRTSNRHCLVIHGHEHLHVHAPLHEPDRVPHHPHDATCGPLRRQQHDNLHAAALDVRRQQHDNLHAAALDVRFFNPKRGSRHLACRRPGKSLK